MERYFRVNPMSGMYREWFKYKDSRNALRELYKKFSDANGIEAESFYATNKALHIVPKGNDNEKFGSILCQSEDGMRKFKASSKIAKGWIQALQSENLEVVPKPMPILYVRSLNGGRYRTRLFDIDDMVYCSIDGFEISEIPEGWEEMKASEFFKIIEDSKSESA